VSDQSTLGDLLAKLSERRRAALAVAVVRLLADAVAKEDMERAYFARIRENAEADRASHAAKGRK
jgi:chorismate mutase